MSIWRYGFFIMVVLGLTNLLMHDWVCCCKRFSDINIWPHNQHSNSFSRVWTFPCSYRSDDVKKVSSHWLHLKGFLPFGIASKHFKCEPVLKCFFSCSEDLTHILHKEHSKGLSSVCTIWCFFRTNFDLNDFSHKLQLNGLSSLCTLWWACSWCEFWQIFLHKLHWNVLSSLCITRCFCFP